MLSELIYLIDSSFLGMNEKITSAFTACNE